MQFFCSVRSIILATLAYKCLAVRNAPDITIGLNTADGSSSALGGLEPALRWSTSRSYGEYDVSGGIDVLVKDFESVPPYSLWGLVKRTIKGYGLSARGEFSVTDPDTVDLDLQCDTPYETTFQVHAAARPNSLSVSKIRATQTVDALDGAFVIAPTYYLDSSRGDVSVAFARDNTRNIQVDLNTDQTAKLSLMQKIGESHILRPSLTSRGQFEMEYENKVDKGTVTATYKANNFVNIKWADGPWQANFNAPMDGYFNFKDGVKVSVKTKVDVNPSF